MATAPANSQVSTTADDQAASGLAAEDPGRPVPTDPALTTAFALGWQMAELYLGADPTSSDDDGPDDLPGISALSAEQVNKLRFDQIEAALTRLEPRIEDAGISSPQVPRSLKSSHSGSEKRKEEMRDLHVEVLRTLTAADFRLGKAYSLGRALYDTCHVDGLDDLRRKLGPDRLGSLYSWSLDLKTALPSHAGEAVYKSLQKWQEWAGQPTVDGQSLVWRRDRRKVREVLDRQGEIWRAVLSGEKQATDTLSIGDYVAAGVGLVRRAHELWKQLPPGLRALILALPLLALAGVALAAIFGSATSVVAALGGLAGTLGISWKGAQQGLGRVASAVRKPLWGAELDSAIVISITRVNDLTGEPARRPPPTGIVERIRRREQPLDVDELLRRHQPRLYYDSQETYFADAADTWTDAPGHVLQRGVGAGAEILASSTPEDDQAQLNLRFLAGSWYANRAGVEDQDTVSAPTKNYLEQANTLHQNLAYANVIYGRAKQDSDGSLWLQYWFFYFYNDYAVAGFGLHEGDWEMIQLRMGSDQQPDLAVYAQHKHAGHRPWSQVERAPDSNTAPVVYVARGSHASYFDKGAHWAVISLDHADGKRRAAAPARLEIVTETSPSWLAWPGWWGDTRKAGKDDLFNQESPRSPCRHSQWADPAALLDTAERSAAKPPQPIPPMPPAPQVVVSREDGLAKVAYSLPERAPGQPPAEKLVVTVNSRDDRLPPVSYAFPVPQATGTVRPERPLVADQHYDLHVSTVSADGVATPAVPIDLAPGQAEARPA